MKKKYIAPVAIALIATIGITTVSCGKPADEEVNATEAEVTTTVESTEETTAPETTETETTVEETTVAETTKEETTAETEAETKVETTKAAAKNETKAETKAAPKAETPKAPAPTQAAPAPTQTPAHTHQWKEHKAAREEWVPNIVSVPDYETVETVTAQYVCLCCGYTTTNIEEGEYHSTEHILNGEMGNYSIREIVTGTENIQIGSHEEDQGYYQNMEYTDYYYCDCGATK